MYNCIIAIDIPDEFTAKAITKQVMEIDPQNQTTNHFHLIDEANNYLFIKTDSKTKRHNIISALDTIQDGITNIQYSLLTKLPLLTNIAIRTKIRQFLEKVTF